VDASWLASQRVSYAVLISSWCQDPYPMTCSILASCMCIGKPMLNPLIFRLNTPLGICVYIGKPIFNPLNIGLGPTHLVFCMCMSTPMCSPLYSSAARPSSSVAYSSGPGRTLALPFGVRLPVFALPCARWEEQGRRTTGRRHHSKQDSLQN